MDIAIPILARLFCLDSFPSNCQQFEHASMTGLFPNLLCSSWGACCLHLSSSPVSQHFDNHLHVFHNIAGKLVGEVPKHMVWAALCLHQHCPGIITNFVSGVEHHWSRVVGVDKPPHAVLYCPQASVVRGYKQLWPIDS